MLVFAESTDVSWIVELINEYSTDTRNAAGESDGAYPDLSGRTNAPAFASTLDRSDLVEAADQLLTVFAVSPDPQAVAKQFNFLLKAAMPQLTVLSNHGMEHGYLIDSSSSPLLVASALSLLDFIEAHGIERLGRCAADNCSDVFVDHSQRRNRTYCSKTCQTRERVARHRRNKL